MSADELRGLVRMARSKARDEAKCGPTEAVEAISTIQCHLQGDKIPAQQLKTAAATLKAYIDESP